MNEKAIDSVYHSEVVDEAFFHQVNGEVIGVEMRCSPEYLSRVIKHGLIGNKILSLLRVEIGDEFRYIVFDDYKDMSKSYIQLCVSTLNPSSLVLMMFFPTKIMEPISIQEASGIILPYSDEGFVFFMHGKDNVYKLPIAKASFSKNKIKKAKQVLQAKYKKI